MKRVFAQNERVARDHVVYRPARAVAQLGRRIAIAAQPRRRFNCQDQDGPMWHERAHEAAALLARSLRGAVQTSSAVTVGDFGCGKESLKSILENTLHRTIQYQGYDLYPQSANVIALDVERHPPTQRFDVVFALGLLEYMSDVAALAQILADVGHRVVVSYVPMDSAYSVARDGRVRLGWRNHHTHAEIETIFVDRGFKLEESVVTNGGRTSLWLWTRRNF